MQNIRYSCQIVMKLQIVRQIFEKYSNFFKTSWVGAELFHADGERGKYNEANSRFSQFFQSA
jgi:hypothetical protein